MSQNSSTPAKHFAYRLGAKLSLSLLYSLVIVIMASVVAYETKFWRLLPWIIGIQIFQSISIFLRSHFSINKLYSWDSLLSILDKLLMIIWLGSLIYIQRENIDILDFAKVFFWSNVISCGVILLLLINRLEIVGLSFSWNYTKDLLRKSFPFALVFLLMTLYTRMDAFMLERLLDDDSYNAGVYAAGFRIYDAVNMIGYLFATLLLPMFSAIIGRAKALSQLVNTGFQMISFIAVTVALICIGFKEEIMTLVYTDTNTAYYNSFAWLSGSFVFVCMGYIFGTLITAGRDLRVFNMILLSGIFVNWTCNLFLIPKMGAEGAALATFITQCCVGMAQIFLAFSLFSLSIRWKEMAKPILHIILLACIIFISRKYLALNWMYLVSIVAILSLIISFIIGQVHFAQWKKIILGRDMKK